MMGLNLNHVNKRGPWNEASNVSFLACLPHLPLGDAAVILKFEFILEIDLMSISLESALMWMPQND